MLRSRRFTLSASSSSLVIGNGIASTSTKLSSLNCYQQKRGIFSPFSSPSPSSSFSSSASSCRFLSAAADAAFATSTTIPTPITSLRRAASTIDVPEEDSSAALEGLDGFASHSFSASTVALVTIGWKETTAADRQDNADAVAKKIVFTVNSSNPSGDEAGSSEVPTNKKSNNNKNNSADKSSCALQQKYFDLPDASADEGVIEEFQKHVAVFLAESAKKVSSETNAVVLIPYDAKSPTYRRLADLLSGLPREGSVSFFFANSDAWSQVYGLYNEHRRKNKGMFLPKSLEGAYEHLTDVKDFIPIGALAVSPRAPFDVRVGAFHSELALETFLLAVQRLTPPMKHLVKQGSFSPRELAAAQACARVVRPVHYFTIKIDNKVAKSVRERTAIRIELFNPQTRRGNVFELTSLSDPKLQNLTAEIGNDISGVTALFVTTDTDASAVQSILRAIKPKNPIFTITVPALASYLDGDDVAEGLRFAEGFKFPPQPRAMWEQMSTAVTSPAALVRAIVGATHHRLRISRSLQSNASGNMIPKQEFIKAKFLRGESASNSSSSSTSASSSSSSPSSSSPRSANPDKVASEYVASASHAKWRSVKTEKEKDVENTLQAWNDAIYASPERSKREEACAAKLDRYLVVDLETTTRSKYRRIANPFTGENHVVLPGGIDHNGTLWMPSKYLGKNDKLKLPDLSKYDVLVGHNVKFDLFYLWHLPELQAFIRRGGMIWDTMYAEYLLSGHEVRLGQGAGLDSVAAGYGGKLKKLDEVKEAWARGVETYDIPYATLAEYLTGDVKNTDFIFKMQRKRALAQKQVNIIQHRMDSLLCTTEMEYNGLKMNVLLAKTHTDKLTAEMQSHKAKLENFVPKQIPACYLREFNWASNQMLISLYFGIPLKFEPLSSSPSFRNDAITLYGGVDNLEASANLAFMSNNLQGTKVVNRFVKPYLRTRGLRTSAALEEAFDDAQVENMFETFFYGVDVMEKDASASASAAVDGGGDVGSSLKNKKNEKNQNTPTTTSTTTNAADADAAAASTTTTTSAEADKKQSASVPSGALAIGNLKKQAKTSALDLVNIHDKKVTKISVVHLLEKIAFEGVVDESSSKTKVTTTKTTSKRKITLSQTTGSEYELQVTTVTGKTFAEVSQALNTWINDVLVSTAPEKFAEQNIADLPRVAILFGRRNCEFFQPLLQQSGFSTSTFTSDSRIPTKIAFGDDSAVELCALKSFTSETVIPLMYPAVAVQAAAVGGAGGVTKSAPEEKTPKKRPSRGVGKGTETETEAAGAGVANSALPFVSHRTITLTTHKNEAAADVLEREQIDGRFDYAGNNGNKSNNNSNLSPLTRAVLFGDRALRLAKLIVGEYHRRKLQFLAERQKNSSSSSSTAAADAKKDKPLKLLKNVSETDVPLEHRAFKMNGIPQTCFLDAPFASKPSAKRATQLVLLRCVGSQLKDEDCFAVRIDEEPPLEIEIPGKLQTLVESEDERRLLVQKFTSPETKKLQVGEDTLSFFAKKGDELSKILLDNRAVEKQLSTYYEDKKSGMMALVHSNDSCIHHELVHNKTTTGRLSSANPNCQNIPKEDKSPIRELFVSRFGKDGVCIEADYSQLEVVTLCCLSKDKQMTQDLFNNVDFHCKRVAMMRPEFTYEEVLQRAKKDKEPEFVKMRSQAKIFSFQRQYGAGVKMLSESTGLNPEVIKQIIIKEKEVYAGTDRFYDMVSLSCHTFDPTLQTGSRNKHGDPIYKGVFPVLTGSRYVFTQSDVPFEVLPGEPTTNYSPTHLKNYPVQGFAGEIVQIMLGQLYRHFVKNKNYGGQALLTNTVHDCVWVDAKREIAKQVAVDVARIMSDARRVLNENWPEIECEVEFPVDVVIGPNMGHVEPAKNFKQ